MSTPSVDCLLIPTGTLARIKEAIRAWTAQTYERRRLTIGLREDSPQRMAIERYVRSLNGSLDRLSLRLYDQPSLDRLAADSDADLVCAWPCWTSQHPRRLQIQIELMQSLQSEAAVFADWIWWHVAERELYWCETWPDGEPPVPGIDDSLLAARAGYAAWRDRLVSLTLTSLTHAGARTADVDGSLDGLARLTDAGALMVTRVDTPAAPDIVRDRAKDGTYVRRQRHVLRDTLPGHRLSRPYLLQVRDSNGGDEPWTALDPFQLE